MNNAENNSTESIIDDETLIARSNGVVAVPLEFRGENGKIVVVNMALKIARSGKAFLSGKSPEGKDIVGFISAGGGIWVHTAKPRTNENVSGFLTVQ